MMQYPGLELAPLREHFGGLPGVAFVENKPSFDAALSRATYQDYFTDRFAGSWGHCTARGDNLIARNAAAAVLSLTGGARPAKAAAGSAYRRARLFSYDEDEPPPPPAVNDSAVKSPAARREKKRDPRADCLAPNPGVDRAALPPSFFDACLEAFPGEPSLLADRGVALFRLGRRADAEDAFRAAIAAKADYLPAYLSLAAAQEARGFAADALATVETGLAKCPETRDRKAYGQALLLRRRLMTSAKRLK
jgi:tetratricopeptide (TPR) repeat protein